MNAYYVVALVGFLVVLAVLLIRFVNATVDKQFQLLARATDDADFRKSEIRRLDALLTPLLPLPGSVRPLAGRGTGFRGGLPPVLMALGIILLWGAGAVRENSQAWLFGGLVCLVLAALVMLLTLSRRKWARLARLLLFRADLKRMDGDRKGAAGDLRELVKLTPWDDAAWAELSDDLAASGDLGPALAAMDEASRIDPRYDEYHMLQASLAIRMGDSERARRALGVWRESGDVDSQDPRLVVYQAALDLDEGRREVAEAALRSILTDDGEGDWEFLDADQALAGVKRLLPGRT